MAKAGRIRIQVWTEHFLGTQAKGTAFLELLHSLEGGRWVPDKWDHFEPVRRPYREASAEQILSALGEERHGWISNNVNFIKRRPYASFSLNAERSKVPSLNSVYVDLDSKEFSMKDGSERIISILSELVRWSGAVFASARHTEQLHWRVAQLTPRERIQEMDWLTFLGSRYVELFGGKQRVRQIPAFEVREIEEGFLVVAAATPNHPEMVDSDRVLLELEEYLGSDAFAGRGYPEIPCRVPVFDLSETVMP